MPQINEYQPQVEAQGAVGGVTPNLEAVSLFGRGVEHIGEGVEVASDVIHKREAQQEKSEVFGQMAQARALWNTKLKQRLNDGSLNTDQFDQEYADYIKGIGQNLQTAEGKDFFNQSANRLGGTLMQNAITGQAQVAGQKAYDNTVQAINTYSSTLMQHPDQFGDVHDEVQTMINGNTDLNAVQKRRLSETLLPELAKGAVRGWAMKDPGTDENGQTHDNQAKALLDNGVFDKYLNSDQKTQMYGFAREQDNLRRISEDQNLANSHRQLELQGNTYMDKIANRVLDGSYDVRELNNAPLTFQQKEYVQAKVKAQVKGEVTTDPIRYNQVAGKIINSVYTSRDQIAAEYNKGGLSPDDADKLMRKIDMTPDGVRLKGYQKELDKDIESLKFKFGGTSTQAGQNAAYAARQEIDVQAEQFVQNGKGTLHDFYMNQPDNAPTNPKNIIAKKRLSAVEQMQAGSQEMQQRATGQQPGAVQFSTSPTKEIKPSPVAPPTGPAKNAKRPGESADDYIKRLRNPQSAEATPDTSPPPTAAAAAPDKTPKSLLEEQDARGGDADFALESIGATGADAEKRRKEQETALERNRRIMKGEKP